jgi:hypothetical protein
VGSTQARSAPAPLPAPSSNDEASRPAVLTTRRTAVRR